MKWKIATIRDRQLVRDREQMCFFIQYVVYGLAPNSWMCDNDLCAVHTEWQFSMMGFWTYTVFAGVNACVFFLISLKIGSWFGYQFDWKLNKRVRVSDSDGILCSQFNCAFVMHCTVKKIKHTREEKKINCKCVFSAFTAERNSTSDHINS